MSAGEPDHIAALLERLGRLIGTDAHAQGLKPVQWEMLRYLQKANRFSNTAAALTAYLGLTKGTVSQSLMALEAKGLVNKQTDARDRRSTRLSLNRAGLRLLDADPLDQTALAIGALPAAARRQLGDALAAVLAKRLSQRERQPFGQCHACRYFARNHPQGRPHRCQLVEEPLSEVEAGLICLEQNPRRPAAAG